MKNATTLLDHPTHRAADQDEASRRVTLVDGAAAEVAGPPGTETLRFFAPGGNLLFEYDARSGKARVSVPDGDLEVASGQGNLTLSGDRRVRIEGESVEIAGNDLALTAGRAELRFGETEFVGRRVRGWLADARLTLRRMETVADTVIRKAKNVYDAVEGLSQLKTGRLRTLVKGTWHSRSRDTVLTADRDVSIDGEEIHLG